MHEDPARDADVERVHLPRRRCRRRSCRRSLSHDGGGGPAFDADLEVACPRDIGPDAVPFVAEHEDGGLGDADL